MCCCTCVNGNGVIRIKQDIAWVLPFVESFLPWRSIRRTREKEKQWRASSFSPKKGSFGDLLKPIFFRFRVDFFPSPLLVCNSNLFSLGLCLLSLSLCLTTVFSCLISVTRSRRVYVYTFTRKCYRTQFLKWTFPVSIESTSYFAPSPSATRTWYIRFGCFGGAYRKFYASDFEYVQFTCFFTERPVKFNFRWKMYVQQTSHLLINGLLVGFSCVHTTIFPTKHTFIPTYGHSIMWNLISMPPGYTTN